MLHSMLALFSFLFKLFSWTWMVCSIIFACNLCWHRSETKSKPSMTMKSSSVRVTESSALGDVHTHIAYSQLNDWLSNPWKLFPFADNSGIAEDQTRKREIRLQKNREAARECRRKKKEYIKCLENRVAVLENQNKALIEELKSLKELYCQTKNDWMWAGLWRRLRLRLQLRLRLRLRQRIRLRLRLRRSLRFAPLCSIPFCSGQQWWIDPCRWPVAYHDFYTHGMLHVVACTLTVGIVLLLLLGCRRTEPDQT